MTVYMDELNIFRMILKLLYMKLFGWRLDEEDFDPDDLEDFDGEELDVNDLEEEENKKKKKPGEDDEELEEEELEEEEDWLEEEEEPWDEDFDDEY